jgi:hypothetical protein
MMSDTFLSNRRISLSMNAEICFKNTLNMQKNYKQIQQQMFVVFFFLVERGVYHCF